MTLQIVPLTSQNQTFTITFSGLIYKISVLWNAINNLWQMTISQNGSTLLSNAPFVTGANILGQYAYLGIGGKMYVITNADIYAPPTLTNLGINSNLYYETS